jgi:hypothetical protein
MSNKGDGMKVLMLAAISLLVILLVCDFALLMMGV